MPVGSRGTSRQRARIRQKTRKGGCLELCGQPLVIVVDTTATGKGAEMRSGFGSVVGHGVFKVNR